VELNFKLVVTGGEKLVDNICISNLFADYASCGFLA